MMQATLDVVIPGIVVGCMYGLVGMAFAFTFKATRIINFAVGEVMMLIAYMSFSILAHWSLHYLYLIPVTIVSSALLGLLIEYTVIRPMRGQPIFSIVMATIGLAFILRSVVVIIWGNNPRPVSVGIPDAYHRILGVNLTLPQIAVAVELVLMCVFMSAFFRFTRIGMLMRATASDESTARLIGIRIGRIHAMAWVGSAIISGLTGVFVALIQSLGPDLYIKGFKGFPATVLGGLDAVVGSGVAGIIIGVTENATGRFFGSGARELAGFVIIIGVLMIRPYGLFGQRTVQRV
jgi:branched-chain amino acid transport system permease protein